MYQQQFGAPAALEAATVTKLVRNLCMVAVIPLVGGPLPRPAGRAGGRRASWHRWCRCSSLGFLLAAAVRTVGDLGDGRSACSTGGVGSVPEGGRPLAAWCLTVAMASVGLGTGLSRIRRLGWKSFAVGLAAALVVGGVGAALVDGTGRRDLIAAV